MPRSISWKLAALLALAATGCLRLPVEPEWHAHVRAISAPDSLAASIPLTVGLEYEHGACDIERRVDTQVRGRVIHIAVVLIYDDGGAGACITPLRVSNTIAFVARPPTGDVILRISRSGTIPIERAIFVAAP